MIWGYSVAVRAPTDPPKCKAHFPELPKRKGIVQVEIIEGTEIQGQERKATIWIVFSSEAALAISTSVRVHLPCYRSATILFMRISEL
jgi:hypothetical protein